MTSVSSLPVLLPAIVPEELDRLDIHLPTVNVISYSGPGESGGVPASLAPVVKRLGTRVNWFALSNLPGNKQGQKSAPTNVRQNDPAQPGFAYYSPQVPAWLVNSHYEVAHDYLSPLLHGMGEQNKFDPEAWKSYRLLCESVASECLTVASDSFPTLCWLHDYQLALAAPVLAAEAGLVLCQFWHVPWPKATVMAQSPIGRELTEALLKNKLVGFHTAEYADNFLSTVAALVPNAQVDCQQMTVTFQGKVTEVTIMPLGIDLPFWQKLAMSTKPMSEALIPKHSLASQIILGVERLEATKGVVERINGIERYLEDQPDMRRRFHYVQISQAGKGVGDISRDYEKLVEERIEAVNKKYFQDGWQPIIHIRGNLDQSQLAAWYQAAAVISVNSISDGLNLIAKEYVACRFDEQGVVVLSRNAGSAKELSQGALLVDPTSPKSVSDALHLALTLEPEEKRRRMGLMRRVIGWNQLHNWALGFLRQALTR
ncbi:MAG: trehalose-6-phosphate synthase [Cyanobacteria bacterium SZAS TMP-1]|nr:trehalose-6-phosphate synthase [Cyanobacteria bacterium SZAS TMP-1]